ncbi:SufD family Fe-S cluster assembly protein [Candidatus Woesearchaeota archaeon]|nr:SufD family Fe-S cluster assembly protein [Nanoarchaeota archaeon]MCB9370318.1 SufD family Fe-S cluster assembly protein [Candidatus Woesearchaeota archaeon]
MANLKERKKWEHVLEEQEKESTLSLRCTKQGDLEEQEADFENEVHLLAKEIFSKLKEKKTYKIQGDTGLEISGKGMLVLDIVQSCTVKIEYEDQSFVALNIKIKKGEAVQIYEKSNSQIFVSSSIDIEENAKCLHLRIYEKMNISLNTTQLAQSSAYEQQTAYLAQDANSFIDSMITHKGKASKSFLESSCIVEGKSIVTNDATIHIREEAKGASGHQKLKNLLLNTGAQVHSEPVLEVDNNEVSCSHGATTSNIEEDLLYYMHSRGLSRSQVIEILKEALHAKVLARLERVTLEA